VAMARLGDQGLQPKHAFDQFVLGQPGGDLPPEAKKNQRPAPAFNPPHLPKEESGLGEEKISVRYLGGSGNTGWHAFLGLTTECSRCHDHKFDPLTQRDFYSLFAFFQNIDESGQTSYFTDSMPVPTALLSSEMQNAKLKDLAQKIRGKEKELEAVREQR